MAAPRSVTLAATSLLASGLTVIWELTLELRFDHYILHEGDTIIFDSTRPHRLTKKGKELMRAIWVILDR